MNILFLSRDYPPHLIGGVGTYIYELSQILVNMGHKVFVLTKDDEFDLEYEDKGVHIFKVKTKKFKIFDPLRDRIGGFLERLEYSYSISKKIKEIVKRYKIDIIESCEARQEGFWYYLFRNHPPLVIKLHTPESIIFKLNGESITLDNFLIRFLEEYWLLKAKKIISVSKAILKLTSDFFQLNFKGTPIIPNPININNLKFYKEIENTTNRPIILYVGRLEFRKGPHVLIRAIPFVIKEMPETKFLFIGSDCGMKQYLLTKVNELNLNKNVSFIDQLPRNKLEEYYQQATICVVPSLWENYPYVILEAMSYAKPIVSTQIGGIPEIIQDRIDGFLVPPGSPNSLAKAILELLNDKDLRKSLGENARKKIEQIYSPFIIAKKTLDIYESLTKKNVF